MANIRQLNDDISKFYPISCIEAIIGGGALTEADDPSEIDLSDCIVEEFAGDEKNSTFKIYRHSNNVNRYEINISRKTDHVMNMGRNLIAKNIPLIYYPDKPILFNTYTNDTKSKCVMMLDIDGRLILNVIPYETYAVTGSNINRYSIIDVWNVSATGIVIKK